MKTLLDAVNSSQVFTDPFPHIVIAAAEPDICTELIEQFPAIVHTQVRESDALTCVF